MSLRVRSGHGCVRWFALLLTGALLLTSAVAQQSSGSNPPNAPSSSQAGAPAAKGESHVDPMAAVPVVNLLSGHSRVFPNLAVSTKPMTSEQKFLLSVQNSLSTYTVLGTAVGAGFGQAMNTNKGYGQGAEGYFKRWGANMAFASSSNLIGTYAIASMTHQDPRYFVQNSGKFGPSVKYAVSRVFLARYDDGHTGTNWATLLGPLGAAGLANVWLPQGSRGAGNTFENYAISIGIIAGTNVLREYWPHLNKKLRLPTIPVDNGLNTVNPSQPAQPASPTPNPK